MLIVFVLFSVSVMYILYFVSTVCYEWMSKANCIALNFRKNTKTNRKMHVNLGNGR